MANPPACFAGIDPGFKGGFALLSADGKCIDAREMPTFHDWHYGTVELDLIGVGNVIDRFERSEPLHWGLEFNSSRPFEHPGTIARFHFQIGALAGILSARTHQWTGIYPQVWKKSLGLEGKTKDPTSIKGMEFLEGHIPSAIKFVRTGRRGAIHDGQLDAVLIAWYLREQYLNPRPL